MHSLVERRVKTEDPFSTFAVEGVINSEILKKFHKTSFSETFRLISDFDPFFFQDIFWGCQYQSNGMEFALDMVLCADQKLHYLNSDLHQNLRRFQILRYVVSGRYVMYNSCLYQKVCLYHKKITHLGL